MSASPLISCLRAASCVLLLGGTAHAQDSDRPDAPPAVQPWPTTDVSDLWHKLRAKDEAPEQDADEPDEASRRFFVLAPGIGARPSTGLTLGLNGNMAFYRGEPATTHLSTMIGGFRVSQKMQVLSNVRFALFAPGDRWLVQGDNRVNWMSLDTYSLGSSAGTAGSVNLKFNAIRLYDTAYHPVAPGLFVGAGFNLSVHRNVRGDVAPLFDRFAYAAYSQTHGFPLDGQRSIGTNVGVLFDTRDNAINAGHGSFASAEYRTFFEALGGNSTWQELSVDVRTFRPLTRSGSQRLAFWFSSDLVTGGVAPYFDLPTTGGDVRSGRGYAEGRYRGERLVYGEVEYRGSVTPSGIVGFVAFLNAATVANADAGVSLFDSYAPAAGFGARVLLNKRSRTNLAVDWGWGKQGSRGFYLGLQEAF
jgi:surface antigen Omp85-like protein